MGRVWKWIAGTAVGLVLLLAIAITATVGWRPFVGPKARPLSANRFEATPEWLKRGQYIATALSGCLYRHAPHDWKAPDQPMIAGTGIAFYDEELFLEVMHTGSVKARKLSPIMPVMVYRNLSDDDLKAMFAFLRTVKRVKHRVDNSAPPTACKVCGQKQGGGEEN